jgi:hypothetical protein
MLFKRRSQDRLTRRVWPLATMVKPPPVTALVSQFQAYGRCKWFIFRMMSIHNPSGCPHKLILVAVNFGVLAPAMTSPSNAE